MSNNSRQYELILFGATGYTGKLTAEWIGTHLPSDLKWAIAGRNAKKLQSVVDELKNHSPNRQQPAIEMCELNKDELSQLAVKTRLIITTIGPYMFYGEPILAACAETGTHYLDCTGEVPWIHDMIPKYHKLAQKNNAIIIPECGLDSVPADLTTYALTAYIRKTLNAPTLNVILSLYAFKSGISGGTSTTILNLFDNYPIPKFAKALHPYSLATVAPTAPAKAPSGGLLGMPNVPELGGWQTTHFMGGVDACITHRSWSLYETSAHEMSEPSLSYGPRFRFNEYMRAKTILYGLSMRFGIALFGFLLALPPTRWILSPLIRRFIIPKPGEGPAKESMKDDFASYKAVGIADTEKKERVTARLDTAHGAYGATALTLTAAAVVILRGRIDQTEAGRLGGGILTPATLGEQYVEKLNEFGMKIQVGV